MTDSTPEANAPEANTPKTHTMPIWARVSVGVLLTVVITSPIALSSQDLVRWAGSPDGLGLKGGWPWLAFVALDAAAATCVLMVTIAAMRAEGGGVFSLLVWLFAAGSAVANWRHGMTTPARDDEYFFPAMSIAGPLLLEVALAKVRRWARIDAHTQLAARPRFGRRWLPGVAFRETLAAWKLAIREDIADPSAAVLRVRQTAALRAMTDTDALVWARVTLAQAGDPDGPIQVRNWLLARGRDIPAITAREEKTAIAARTAPAPQTPDPAQPMPGRDSGLAQPPGPARPTNGAVHANGDGPVATTVALIKQAKAAGQPAPRDEILKQVRALGHTLSGPDARALWAEAQQIVRVNGSAP